MQGQLLLFDKMQSSSKSPQSIDKWYYQIDLLKLSVCFYNAKYTTDKYSKVIFSSIVRSKLRLLGAAVD